MTLVIDQSVIPAGYDQPVYRVHAHARMLCHDGHILRRLPNDMSQSQSPVPGSSACGDGLIKLPDFNLSQQRAKILRTVQEL
jgi:hypothetical protein